MSPIHSLSFRPLFLCLSINSREVIIVAEIHFPAGVDWRQGITTLSVDWLLGKGGGVLINDGLLIKLVWRLDFVFLENGEILWEIKACEFFFLSQKSKNMKLLKSYLVLYFFYK